MLFKRLRQNIFIFLVRRIKWSRNDDEPIVVVIESQNRKLFDITQQTRATKPTH